MHVVELDRQIVLVLYYWYIILLSMMERLSLRDEISESLGKKLDTSIIRVDAVEWDSSFHHQQTNHVHKMLLLI